MDTSINKKNYAIVIGAGIGGLSAAIRLAQKGLKVHVYEANAQAGGKAHRLQYKDYSWGFGPSLLTLPNLIDELFLLCNKNPKDYYKYHRLDPICKYFYDDGTIVNAFADNDAFAKELNIKLNEPIKNTLAYFKKTNHMYDVTKNIFLYKSLHRISTYLQKGIIKSILNLPFLGLTKSLHKANSKFFSKEKTIQLFNRYATYNGSDPYIAPATLNVISVPEYRYGGYIMEGGMPALSEALYKLAIDMGVVFTFNTKVKEIVLQEKIAVGIQVNNETFYANYVISNMDVYYTYKNLLPNIIMPRSLKSEPRSTSAVIFYWAVEKKYTALECHNILFSKDYKEEFYQTSILKTTQTDPTTYIFISKKHMQTHAPENCENWFTVVNVTCNEGQDWDALVPILRKNVINKINKTLNTDIEKYIVHEKINDPTTIESKTWSYKGSIYGNSSNSKMAAFMRHANFSKQIKQLYFVGGSVHPGGGVPLALLSGKIATENIKKN